MKDYLESSWGVRLGRAAGRWIGSGLSVSAEALLRRSGLRSFWVSFRAAPLQTGGLILAVAVLTHLSLLWMLRRPLSFGGWLIRLGLLGLGLQGFRSRSSWSELWQGSLLFQLLKRGKG